MTTIEKPGSVEVEIALDFEEAIVAASGLQRIQEAKRENQEPVDRGSLRLLERTTDHWELDAQGSEPTLMDQIFCTDQADDALREYGPEDSLRILEGIWALASDPKSEYHLKATKMKVEASNKAPRVIRAAIIPAEPIEKPIEIREEASQPPKSKHKVPPALSPMEIRGTKVVLRGFEQYVATRKAVAEFLGNDCELLAKKSRKRGEGYNLAAVEHTVSIKDRNQSGEFSGTYAAQILEALKKAAERNETILDGTAAYMLAHAAIFEEAPEHNNVTVISSSNVYGQWRRTRVRAADKALGGNTVRPLRPIRQQGKIWTAA